MYPKWSSLLFLLFSSLVQSQNDTWGTFGECSVTCGGGAQFRKCQNPPCDGSAFQSCNSNKCPTDGGWSDWGPCSVGCGGGAQTRTCSNPFPSQDTNPSGAICPGGISQRDCNSQACNAPAVDGGWTDFGPCSAYCGKGVRTRTCTNPTPQNSGKQCSGSSSQSCSNPDCSNSYRVEFLLSTSSNDLPVDPSNPSNPTSDLSLLSLIIESDLANIYGNDSMKWLTVKLVSVNTQQTGANVEVKAAMQLDDTGLARDPPNTPLTIAQNFAYLVSTRSDYIFDDSRHVTDLIDDKSPVALTEIKPPYKFKFVWWMGLVIAGFVLLLIGIGFLIRWQMGRNRTKRANQEMTTVDHRNHLASVVDMDPTEVAYMKSLPTAQGV